MEEEWGDMKMVEVLDHNVQEIKMYNISCIYIYIQYICFCIR